MDKLGVYIHIPFCQSKCAYCDFYSLAGKEALMPYYQNAIISHIKEYSEQLNSYLIDTVYFGGGTPSYFGATRLTAIFNALKKYAHVSLDAEVTAECNPESVTRDEMSILLRAGFNRVSIGVQSTDDKMLQSIGRIHTFAKAEEAVEAARDAGFKNIGIDLIYGLPSQTREEWSETLNRATALKPDHISCYGLKIEDGTPMVVLRDSPFLPDDDTQADMYLYAVAALARFGYRQYEISNFSRRGFESRHNMKYWIGEEYIGFGAAAYSYIGGRRYGYIANLDKYIENIMSDQSVIEIIEEMTEFERACEYLMLGLRTVRGISDAEYRAIYHCDMSLIINLLTSYEERGWAVLKDGRWCFTPSGFLLSNVLIGEILDAQTQERAELARPWLNASKPEAPQLSLFGKRLEKSYIVGSE